jgi:hypothetical protein
MPAYFSYKLQPLDVSYFTPLKKAYKILINQKARLGVSHINKFNFLKAFLAARKSAFQPETIRNSFAGTGLVLFNPDRVLSQLKIQLKTPTPLDSRLTNSAPKTPYTTKQLEKQASATKKLLKKRAESSFPLLEARLDKIIKGHKLMFNELVLARDEIRKYRANNK